MSTYLRSNLSKIEILEVLELNQNFSKKSEPSFRGFMGPFARNKPHIQVNG